MIPLVAGLTPRAIFFDLDGTLVDSIPDLAHAIDGMLVDLQFSPAGEESVRLWVGNGARKLVQRALAHVLSSNEHHIDEAVFTKAHALFIQHYQQSADNSRLYPNVLPTLIRLKAAGFKLALITNKPVQFIPSILAHVGLSEMFEVIVGGDSLAEQKPHPLPLLHVMQQFELQANECLMVGDSGNDIYAAKACGMPSVCVTYGYNHGEDPLSLPANAHIDDFAQLIAD